MAPRRGGSSRKWTATDLKLLRLLAGGEPKLTGAEIAKAYNERSMEKRTQGAIAVRLSLLRMEPGSPIRPRWSPRKANKVIKLRHFDSEATEEAPGEDESDNETVVASSDEDDESEAGDTSPKNPSQSTPLAPPGATMQAANSPSLRHSSSPSPSRAATTLPASAPASSPVPVTEAQLFQLRLDYVEGLKSAITAGEALRAAQGARS